MKKNIWLTLKSMMFLGLATGVNAQQEAGSFFVGGFEVTPVLNLRTINDSNVYASPTEDSSRFTLINPSVTAIFDTGVSGLSLGYSLRKGEYSSLEEENYTDQRFDASFGVALGQDHRFQVDASLFQAHDARGADAPSGEDSNDLDEYDDTTVRVNYRIGADDSRLRLQLTAGVLDREYTTNEATTRFQNREEVSYQGEASLYLLNGVIGRLRAGALDINYDELDELRGDRDSDETRYGVGLTWDPGSQTRLNLDWGVVDRSFEATNREDFSINSWTASFDWLPVSYSTITFTSSQETEEVPRDEGDAIVRTVNGVSWTHDWNSRFRTQLEYRNSEADFRGAERNDDIDEYSLDINYDMTRWLSIGVIGQYSDQDSNSPGLSYDRRQIGLDFRATL